MRDGLYRVTTGWSPSRIGTANVSTGAWLRRHCDDDDEPYAWPCELPPVIYRWGNNPRRAELKGRQCVVLARGALGSILVMFLDTGEKVVTSHRAVA